MSEEPTLENLSIAELNERKAEIPDDDSGVNVTRREAIDEELERREDERAERRELVESKIVVAEAKEHGLGDDPAVEALEEDIAEVDAARHPDPRRELAEAAGVDVERVAGLGDAEVEEVRGHVEAIEVAAGSSNTGMQVSLEEHVDALEEVLADHDDVGVEVLVPESAVVDEPGVSVETLVEEGE